MNRSSTSVPGRRHWIGAVPTRSFRVHGSRCRTEAWRFAERTSAVVVLCQSGQLVLRVNQGWCFHPSA